MGGPDSRFMVEVVRSFSCQHFVFVFFFRRKVLLHVDLLQKTHVYTPRTQKNHILEDLTHKVEGQPPQKKASVGF